MKKITFLSVITISLLSTSCKKNWTCECTGATNINISITNKTKSNAKTICDSYENTYSTLAQATKCDLK